jgi:hypothetical protein
MSETVYKTVVLYKGSHDTFVNEVGEYMDKNYPRLSEELEIALTLLPKENQINNQVELLDKEMEDIRNASLKKLEELSLRKQELLAIGYEGENNEI